LLEQHGLSQKQLADDLNISASAVGNYVRNNREPDFETLKEFAKYFHVSTDYLLNFQSGLHDDFRDQMVLQIFHSLTEDQKDLYMEQGKLFVKSNLKKKETSSISYTKNKAI